MFDTPTSDPSAGPHARFTLVSHRDDDDYNDDGDENDDDNDYDGNNNKTMMMWTKMTMLTMINACPSMQ